LWKKGLQIDRRDNDGNYKPSNCRFTTQIENLHNRKLLQRDNSSGYRGVSHHNKKWRAYITENEKQKWLGHFKNKADAIIARKMAEYELGFYVNHGRKTNSVG